MDYKKARRVDLRSHPDFDEKWLQRQIAKDPGLLGLGELDVKDIERRQPHAGRLDILLFDPANNTRYEVEVQLGATDESHILRTLEYWDNERRRYPQYEHVAVLVAEEVTGRFLNVINLFNQAIPLIAIQLSALDVDGVLTLNATKVLDIALPAPEEDDEAGKGTTRKYWEEKSSKAMLELVDRVLEVINTQGEPMALKYNIGLQREGVADNFIDFTPRRETVITAFRIEHCEALDDRIDETSLTRLPYDKSWKKYRLQLRPADLSADRSLLVELIRLSRGLPVPQLPQQGTSSAHKAEPAPPEVVTPPRAAR